MNGLILVHKPAPMTSHDVVVRIRKTVRPEKVGHFGTLDPWATGLLLIAVGKATRLFPLFLKSQKTYQAQIKLGLATDTYDYTGSPLAAEVKDCPDRQAVLKAMKGFTGEILQIPPLYSAKKHLGKPLYILARKNQKIELKPSKVFVRTFEIRNYEPPLLECLVRCSSGTYIRSLAHDLGQKLGCGAHLVRLVRTAIDPYRLEESHHLEEIQEKANKGSIHELLIPLESLLPHLPKVVLSETGSRLAKSGNIIFHKHILGLYECPEAMDPSGAPRQDQFRLFSSEGRLLAFARQDFKINGLHPYLVIDSENRNG